MTTKRCRGCGVDRPLGAFAKWAQRCDECKQGKAIVVAEPPKVRSKSDSRPQWLAPPRWSRPGGLGFDVCLEVDESQKRTDIKLEQTSEALGTQSIWLNQAEARELHSWLTAQLGDT